MRFCSKKPYPTEKPASKRKTPGLSYELQFFLSELTPTPPNKPGSSRQNYKSLKRYALNLLHSEIGSRFSVLREEKELRDRTQTGSPVIGKLVHLLGELTVVSNTGPLAPMAFSSQFYPVNRRDKIMLIPKVIGSTNAEFPNRDLIPQIVRGEELETNFIRQGQLLVLNKGTNHLMKEAYLFKVFEDTAPVLNTTEIVSPTSKGEVKIVSVEDDSSIGIVNRNAEPLTIGDSLVSFMELPDRPMSPKRNRQEISVD